ESGGRSGYVRSPTQTGKGIVELALVAALNVPTLIVTWSRKSLAQLLDNSSAHLCSSKVAAFDHTEGSLNPGEVRILTFKKFLNIRRDHPVFGNLGLAILDEGHKALGPKTSAAILEHLPHACLKFGFTATPHYSASKSLSTLLGTEIFSRSLTEARSLGQVADFECHFYVIERDISKVPIIKGEYHRNHLEMEILASSAIASAVSLYRSDYKNERVIINVATRKLARATAAAFIEAGIPAASYTSDLSSNERDRILRDHQAGSIRVVIQVQALGLSYSDPGLASIFNLTPTLSQVHQEQRSGRHLAVTKENDGKKKTIVDFLYRSERFAECVTFAEIAGVAEPIVPDMFYLDPSETSSKPKEKGAIRDPEIVCSIALNLAITRASDAQLEWRTPRSLRAELNMTASEIVRLVTLVPRLFADYRKDFIGKLSDGTPIYSPELVNYLLGFSPKNGWRDLQDVLVELGYPPDDSYAFDRLYMNPALYIALPKLNSSDRMKVIISRELVTRLQKCRRSNWVPLTSVFEDPNDAGLLIDRGEYEGLILPLPSAPLEATGKVRGPVRRRPVELVAPEFVQTLQQEFSSTSNVSLQEAGRLLGVDLIDRAVGIDLLREGALPYYEVFFRDSHSSPQASRGGYLTKVFSNGKIRKALSSEDFAQLHNLLASIEHRVPIPADIIQADAKWDIRANKLTGWVKRLSSLERQIAVDILMELPTIRLNSAGPSFSLEQERRLIIANRLADAGIGSSSETFLNCLQEFDDDTLSFLRVAADFGFDPELIPKISRFCRLLETAGLGSLKFNVAPLSAASITLHIQNRDRAAYSWIPDTLCTRCLDTNTAGPLDQIVTDGDFQTKIHGRIETHKIQGATFALRCSNQRTSHGTILPTFEHLYISPATPLPHLTAILRELNDLTLRARLRSELPPIPNLNASFEADTVWLKLPPSTNRARKRSRDATKLVLSERRVGSAIYLPIGSHEIKRNSDTKWHPKAGDITDLRKFLAENFYRLRADLS
ncbi:MAG: hypothetical protein KDD42_02040, partial [Bdellovibrionales bacterium]|nr:hypothetical protein [Bdellovibrionales bacterium]